MVRYVRARKTKDARVARCRDGSTRWRARYWAPNTPARGTRRCSGRRRSPRAWLTKQGASVLDGSRMVPRRGGRPFREVARHARRGAHPNAIQERLGHQPIRMPLDRCGHLLPGLGDTLADALDGARTPALRPRDNGARAPG